MLSISEVALDSLAWNFEAEYIIFNSPFEYDVIQLNVRSGFAPNVCSALAPPGTCSQASPR